MVKMKVQLHIEWEKHLKRQKESAATFNVMDDSSLRPLVLSTVMDGFVN